MKQATWGWSPPKYQECKNNKYMIIFKTEEVKQTVTHIDYKTKEKTKKLITSWNVW